MGRRPKASQLEFDPLDPQWKEGTDPKKLSSAFHAGAMWIFQHVMHTHGNNEIIKAAFPGLLSWHIILRVPVDLTTSAYEESRLNLQAALFFAKLCISMGISSSHLRKNLFLNPESERKI